MKSDWIVEHSPWVTGGAATVAVASDPATPSAVVGLTNGALIPIVAFAINYFFVNVLPKIRTAVLDWQDDRDKRRAGSLTAQLAALQVNLTTALASVSAKDETIAALHVQLTEERAAMVAKLSELTRQVEKSNEQALVNHDLIQSKSSITN